MKADYSLIHKDIVDGCKDGNQLAQKQLYQLYAKAMLNTSYRIVGSVHEAEDILQEAFIDIFTKIHSFRSESSIGAWIKRIVVNKSINVVKRNKKLYLIEAYDDIADEENTSLQKELQHVLDLDRVKKGISLLPDGYRIVLTLYLLEGFSHKEIASQLDISESTSKSQYNRAKKKLKELIGNTNLN